jgi:hypothetical protein
MKALLSAIFLISAINLNIIAQDDNKPKENQVKQQFLKEKYQSDIKKALDQKSQDNILTKLIDLLSFEHKNMQMVTIPIIQTSKDMSASYGLMPIMAFNKSINNKLLIKSVLAPSFDYNRYLGKTLTQRHYFFPDEKSIMMYRISFSEHTQKELIFWYYQPEFLMKNTRLDFQVLDSANPKFSFYGFGPNSRYSDKANYTFYQKGAQLTLTKPIFENIYWDYSVSFYSNKIDDGIIDSKNKFSSFYPSQYSELNSYKKFFLNKFSLLFDSTDHPFLPKLGNYFIFSAEFSDKDILSDYTYSDYSFEIKKYYKYGLNDRYVTAVRYLLEWQKGQRAPFYAMPRLGETSGLRAFGDGRFTDRVKFVVNIEQRITMSKFPLRKFISEFELTPFIDIGTVSDKVSNIKADNLNFAPGISSRLLIRPHIVATLDFAYSKEGINSIIRVGYPF